MGLLKNKDLKSSRIMIGYTERLCSQGISMIDLVLVIMIIGIMVTVITPQFQSALTEMRLDGAAGELVYALEYAKSLAVKYQRPFKFKIYRYDYENKRNNQFTIKDFTSPLDDSVHPDADPPLFTYQRVYHPVDKIPYIIDFDDLPTALDGILEPKKEYEGVKILSIPVEATSADVIFYPDGHCSDTNISFTLGLGQEQRTVTVNGISGKITVN
ncbi:MAG: hypothetical protein JRH18_02705 [Deltaproteobacteria bacterium]|nr:hypothetical protein [Deltaproteobacteria bacterium]MBW2150558.1 hypothetical protein [Deltaproteobacteria bacterium]